MDYIAPLTLDGVYQALEREDASCLAGGQSLVAMMNLGLVAPSRLVSLRKISALRGTNIESDGSMRIGAMTTHAELAALDPPGGGPALLAQAARVVAYPAVRAFGTIGGSVAHADPAADYPVALIAADAAIEVGSATGSRRIAASDFFRGMFETALRRGEIVTAIIIPPAASDARSAYEKLSLVVGDFAIMSVAAVVTRTARVSVGGCGATPLMASGLELADTALREAARKLAATCDPPTDHRASAAYRRKVLPELVCRAVEAART